MYLLDKTNKYIVGCSEKNSEAHGHRAGLHEEDQRGRDHHEGHGPGCEGSRNKTKRKGGRGGGGGKGKGSGRGRGRGRGGRSSGRTSYGNRFKPAVGQTEADALKYWKRTSITTQANINFGAFWTGAKVDLQAVHGDATKVLLSMEVDTEDPEPDPVPKKGLLIMIL